jgi:hypothetical protein
VLKAGPEVTNPFSTGPSSSLVMRHHIGIQRQGGECVLRGHSGLEALGGGLFEEVVQTPLGKCSINTHSAFPFFLGSSPPEFPSVCLPGPPCSTLKFSGPSSLRITESEKMRNHSVQQP